MAHTPGPWEARPNDGQIILNGSNAYDIQEIYNDQGGFNPDDIRLMAAAPDLLAALWYAYDYMNDRSRACPQDSAERGRLTEAQRLAAEAVSKALGREVT